MKFGTSRKAISSGAVTLLSRREQLRFLHRNLIPAPYFAGRNFLF
jgi:hypothetical protein